MRLNRRGTGGFPTSRASTYSTDSGSQIKELSNTSSIHLLTEKPLHTENTVFLQLLSK